MHARLPSGLEVKAWPENPSTSLFCVCIQGISSFSGQYAQTDICIIYVGIVVQLNFKCKKNLRTENGKVKTLYLPFYAMRRYKLCRIGLDCSYYGYKKRHSLVYKAFGMCRPVHASLVQ